MPNFHSLRIFEHDDYRLIVTVPKERPAEDLRAPEEDPEPPVSDSDCSFFDL